MQAGWFHFGFGFHLNFVVGISKKVLVIGPDFLALGMAAMSLSLFLVEEEVRKKKEQKKVNEKALIFKLSTTLWSDGVGILGLQKVIFY